MIQVGENKLQEKHSGKKRFWEKMRIDNSLCGIDELDENIPTQIAFFAFVTFRLSNYLINTLHSLVLTRGLSFPNEKAQNFTDH